MGLEGLLTIPSWIDTDILNDPESFLTQGIRLKSSHITALTMCLPYSKLGEKNDNIQDVGSCFLYFWGWNKSHSGHVLLVTLAQRLPP